MAVNNVDKEEGMLIRIARDNMSEAFASVMSTCEYRCYSHITKNERCSNNRKLSKDYFIELCKNYEIRKSAEERRNPPLFPSKIKYYSTELAGWNINCCLGVVKHIELEHVLEDLKSVSGEIVSVRGRQMLEGVQTTLSHICDEIHVWHEKIYDAAIDSWSRLDYARFVFILLTSKNIDWHNSSYDSINWTMSVFQTPTIVSIINKIDPFKTLEYMALTFEQRELATAVRNLSQQPVLAVSEKERKFSVVLKLLKSYNVSGCVTNFEFKFVAAGLSLLAKNPSTPSVTYYGKRILENACQYFTEYEIEDPDNVENLRIRLLMKNLGLDERGYILRNLISKRVECCHPLETTV
jgi:hypothetical protein